MMFNIYCLLFIYLIMLFSCLSLLVLSHFKLMFNILLMNDSMAEYVAWLTLDRNLNQYGQAKFKLRSNTEI
jgi:type IV secretory pathway VirB3-like protein